MDQGWECPKCGAVMSPNEKVCINCSGNVFPLPSYPITPESVNPIIIGVYATPQVMPRYGLGW